MRSRSRASRGAIQQEAPAECGRQEVERQESERQVGRGGGEERQLERDVVWHLFRMSM